MKSRIVWMSAVISIFPALIAARAQDVDLPRNLLLPGAGRAGVSEFREYPTPSFGFHMTSGPGGFWFTEPAVNRIAKFNPADGQFTEYPITTANSNPSVIAACADGNLWFTEQAANQIGRCTSSGSITEFPIPTPNSRPFGVACQRDHSDGHMRIWFTEADGNNIGRLEVFSDYFEVIEFAVPTSMSTPAFVTIGPDRNVWFTEATASKIGKLDALSGLILEYSVPTLSILNGLAPGPDGKLWFTEYLFGNNIGSINPEDGMIREYLIPTPNSGAFNSVGAADGDLYFTEQLGNKIARLDLETFAIEEIAFPAGGGPSGLASRVRRVDEGNDVAIADLAVLLPDRSTFAVAQILRPALAFTKTAFPNPVRVEEELTYTLTATNTQRNFRRFKIMDQMSDAIQGVFDQPDWLYFDPEGRGDYWQTDWFGVLEKQKSSNCGPRSCAVPILS